MKLGEGFIEVRPDTRGFKGQLEKDVQRDASSVASTLGKALAGGAFLAGTKKAVDAASDLNEAVNVTNITFGKAEGKVADFAKTAAESIGQSERAARQATATFGGLLLNLGYTEDAAADTSIQLTKLASDLASAFNTDPAEAAAALASALRGEQEPIQRYNVLLSEAAVANEAVRLGLAASTGAVDQHAKVQARLSLIMEQTSRVQGDFANTSDGLANSQRIAAAKAEDAAADLGDNLLPIYTKLSEVVGTVADAFGSLPEPVQTGLIAIAGIAALSGPIKASTEAMGSMATIARGRLSSGLESAGLRGLYLKDSLGSIASVAGGPAVAALGLFALALFDAKNRADEMRKAAKELRDEAEQTGDSLEEISLRKLVEDLTSVERVRDAMDKLGVSFEDLRVPLQGTRAEYQAWLDDLNREHAGDVRVEILTKQVGKARSALQEARETTEAADEATSDLGISQDKTAGSTTNLTDQLKEQEDALNSLLDATLAQFDANVGYRRSVDDAEDSLADLTETQREHGAQSEEYRDALLDAEQALLDQAEAAVRLAEDTAKATGETITAQERTAIYRAELVRLRDSLAPGSPLRKALDEYIRTIDHIPIDRTTTLKVDDAKARRDLASAIAYLNRQIELNPLSIDVAIAEKFATGRTSTTGHAAGGQVLDGDFIVGEAGAPELLRKRGSDVEVLAGAPRRIGFDGVGEESLLELRLISMLLGQAVSLLSPTASRGLRNVKLDAGAI